MNVNSVNFAPNQMNYVNNNSLKQNKVTFQGALGDKFVRDIALMADVDTNAIMKEIKGTFGPKTEKVQDVIESFVDALRKMTLQGKKLEGDLRQANEKISQFPNEKNNAVFEAEKRLRTSFMETLNAKNKEIEAAKAETKEAQDLLEKYKPVVNVKSVEEIGTVMPDKVLEVLNEMVEHKAAANKSMFEFLMTGKGQEEALAQIERNNILQKARKDGILNISEVGEASNKISREHSLFTGYSESNFTVNLIEKALMSDAKGEYLASKVVKDQVKKNAMAILAPMADERYYNTGLGAIEKNLDKILDDVVKFHKNFKSGVEKVKQRYAKAKDFEMTINKVENDVDKSKVAIKYTETYGGTKNQPVNYELTFEQIANQANYI